MRTEWQRRAAIVSTVIIISIVAGGGIVAAQDGEASPSCSGDFQAEWPDWGFASRSGSLRSHGSPTALTVAAELPAGTYDVDTTSYDGDDGRHEDIQDFEQYQLEFLDADGLVIDSTGSTPDLADGVNEVTWSGPVGRVVLDRPAASVRAQHSFVGDWSSANSVMPVCLGVVVVSPPTTTTTEASRTTPSTEGPMAVVTTTTAPTGVGGIQQSAPAEPVTATPSFTG